jgi:hypothetical protein
MVHSKAGYRRRVGIPPKRKRFFSKDSVVIEIDDFAPNWAIVKVEGSVCPLGRGCCDFVSSCDDVIGFGHNCSRVR